MGSVKLYITVFCICVKIGFSSSVEFICFNWDPNLKSLSWFVSSLMSFLPDFRFLSISFRQGQIPLKEHSTIS